MDIKYIENRINSTIEYHEEIDSTNVRGKEIAERNYKTFLSKEEIFRKNLHDIEEVGMILAENQTNGKGTNGRKWLARANENILMTIIYYPKNTIEELSGITYKIAEKIQFVIQNLYKISTQIKLPNDILLNGKKICGILTESAIQGSTINYILIGIGLNVNQIIFEDEIKNIATSLKKEYPGKNYKREDIIVQIYNNIKTLFIT